MCCEISGGHWGALSGRDGSELLACWEAVRGPAVAGYWAALSLEPGGNDAGSLYESIQSVAWGGPALRPLPLQPAGPSLRRATHLTIK